MKRLLAAAALAMPLFAHADVDIVDIGDFGGGHGPIIIEVGNRQQALRTAQDLAQTLAQISREAERVADQASMNGNRIRARRFEDVAYISRNLTQDLRQEVVRPLRQGVAMNRVSNALDSLQRDFADLNNAFNVIVMVPANLEELAHEGRQLHQALKRLL